jgi:hypothetical protein
LPQLEDKERLEGSMCRSNSCVTSAYFRCNFSYMEIISVLEKNRSLHGGGGMFGQFRSVSIATRAQDHVRNSYPWPTVTGHPASPFPGFLHTASHSCPGSCEANLDPSVASWVQSQERWTHFSAQKLDTKSHSSVPHNSQM